MESSATEAVSKLTWGEIADAASEMFDIWVDQPELRWASDAWAILTMGGLTRYSSSAELAIVKIRLMAVAAFYCDFCHLAWQETVYPQYSYWAEMLCLEAVRIGQLLPRTPEWDTTNDKSLLVDGLKYLADKERETVVRVLLEAYGSTSSLLCALSNSNKEPLPADLDDIEELTAYVETPEQILNDPGSYLGPAFAWLDQGAEQVLDCRNDQGW